MGGSFAYGQQSPTDGGIYYLYNAESGQFLSRGNEWGTRAVTIPVGTPWQLSASGSNYKIRMYDLVVDKSTAGFGNNCFTDNGSPLDFTLEGSAADGYTFKTGDNYITAPASAGNVLLSATASKWLLLNKDEYAAKMAAKAAAQEAQVAASAGIELGSQTLASVLASDYIGANTVDAVPTKEAWNIVGVTNRVGSQNHGGYGVEIYQGGGSLSKTITGLQKGVYKVKVKGLKRMTGNATCYQFGKTEGYNISDAYFVANGNVVQIADWASACTSSGTPNSVDAAKAIWEAGDGYIREVYCYVGDDGELKMQAKSEAYWGASWFLFGGVEYTYYTDAPVDEATAAALIASVPTGKMSAADQSALNTAKSDFEGNKSIKNYNALDKAIAAANASISAYAKLNTAISVIDGINNAAVQAAFADAKTAYNDGTFSTEQASDAAVTTFQAAIKQGYADIADGKYYIQNTQSAQYISNGAYWGTRAVLSDAGLEYTVTKGGDGKYTLKSGVAGADAAKALRPSDGYNDQNGAWEILKSDDGKMYMFNGSLFFFYNGTQIPEFTADPSSDAAKWQFVSFDERAALLPGENVDATMYINNPSFIRGLDGSAWQNIDNTTKFEGDRSGGSTLINGTNAETYDSKNFDVYQELTGLPTGFYKLTMQGYTRDGATDVAYTAHKAGTEHLAVLYAGDKEVALKSIFADAKTESAAGWTTSAADDCWVPLSQGDAAVCFNNGAYVNTLDEILVSDGTLRIGVKLNDKEAAGANWTVFDEFRLTYVKPAAAATMTIGSAKYGTFCAPFDVTLPEGVTAVTATAVTESTISYDVVAEAGETLAANTPVVVKSENAVSATFYGQAATTDFVTKNLLTGVYKDYTSKDGDYILQNQSGKVGFYLVDTNKATPKVKAYRAYLNVPGAAANAAGIRVFYLEDEDIATGINAAEATQSQDIYDLSGRKVNKMQKGIYIVGDKKVLK